MEYQVVHGAGDRAIERLRERDCAAHRGYALLAGFQAPLTGRFWVPADTPGNAPFRSLRPTQCREIPQGLPVLSVNRRIPLEAAFVRPS